LDAEIAELYAEGEGPLAGLDRSSVEASIQSVEQSEE